MNSVAKPLHGIPLPHTAAQSDSGVVGSIVASVGAVMRTMAQRLIPWIVPLLLVVAWHIASSAGWMSTRVLPAPLDVARATRTLAESGELWTHVKVSTARALLGLAVGGGLGLVLGLLTGSVRLAETLLDSTIQVVRNIPALAMIPLVILWFGIDETAKLFLIAVAVFFPIYLNTFHGIRNVDPGLIEMGRTYGLSRWGLYTQIILPGALSSILVGLRFSLGLMWVILIVAETISAQAGIGYLTMSHFTINLIAACAHSARAGGHFDQKSHPQPASHRRGADPAGFGQTLRPARRAAQHAAAHRAGPVCCHRRAQRLRQEHAVAPGRRAGRSQHRQRAG